MNLNEWAIKWGVPFEAVEDLRVSMGVADREFADSLEHQTETDVQTGVRVEASKKGLRLWRNNLGAVYTEDGRFIRYGLANDTKQMNEKIKSSDLIGIRPVTVEQRDVGRVIGQFVAREVKAGSWNYSGTKREEAQLNFLNLVLSLGGDAAFAKGAGTL